MYPDDLRYSKDHEWVRKDDGECEVGITDFAQGELGEVVFVELPDVGDTFEAGEEVGTIESVKAVAEVYAPIAGEIVAVNDRLTDEPEKVNEDPHGEGWLIRMKPTSIEAWDELMNAAAYAEFIDNG